MMKRKLLPKCVIVGVMALSASSIGYAELSEGELKVAGDIAADFEDSFGTGTGLLVENLRNGDDFSFEVEVEQGVVDENGEPVLIEAVDENGDTILDENGDPVLVQQTELVIETIEAENLNGAMGFGEISLALGLAESQLGEGATMADVLDFFHTDDGTGILDQRLDGMGWGPIFAQYGVTVGEIMRGLKAQGAIPESSGAGQSLKGKGAATGLTSQQSDRPDQPGRPDRPDRPGRPDRPDRPVDMDIPDRPDRPERPDRPDRPERPERPERP